MRRTLPSSTALQCFEQAARLENFSQAAQSLNMTQSALSRQIKLLETRCGQPLFIRERQRVRLSQAGKWYLSAVIPLLEGLETATLRVQSFSDPAGSINLGTYPTLGARWLMPYLVDFQEAHPTLNLNTISYLDNTGFDPQLVDIGIVQGTPPWPGMRADYLMPEHLATVCSPKLLSQPVDDAEQLLAHRLLHHSTRPHSWNIWFKALGQPLNETPMGIRYNQYEMIIEALRAGYGIGVLPTVLIQRELNAGRLVMAHKFIAPTKACYSLLTPLNKVGNSRIELFREWFLSTLKQAQSAAEHIAAPPP